MVSTDPVFLIIILVVSLMSSIPCLILFIVLYNYLMDTSWSGVSIKLTLFIISELVITFWIYMLTDGGNNLSILRYGELIIPIALTIGGSIWFYEIDKIKVDGK